MKARAAQQMPVADAVKPRGLARVTLAAVVPVAAVPQSAAAALAEPVRRRSREPHTQTIPVSSPSALDSSNDAADEVALLSEKVAATQRQLALQEAERDRMAKRVEELKSQKAARHAARAQARASPDANASSPSVESVQTAKTKSKPPVVVAVGKSAASPTNESAPLRTGSAVLGQWFAVCEVLS